MTASKQDLAELTVEDIMESPTKFGMPTFEEFRKDPEKWKGRHDENLALTDASTTVKDLRNKMSTQTYTCLGFDCGKSLERVEHIAKQEGYRIDQLDMSPTMIPEAGGKFRMQVNFVPKAMAIKTVSE